MKKREDGPRRRTGRRYRLGMVAAVAALALSGCRHGTGGDVIRVSGNIEMTEVRVAFKISGKLVERTVDEGDPVTKGQVIARLDQEQLLQQKHEAEAALAAARSAWRQVRTAVHFQQANLAGWIAERRAQLAQAEARLRELEAGSRPQEIQQARARVAAVRTEYVRAAADWKRAQPLYRADDISRAQYDQFRARYEASKADLRQAEQALSLVREGPRKETIQAARAAVEQARAAVRLAAAQRLELKRRRQELRARQAEVRRAEAQVALLASRLRDAVAVAPISGVVLAKSAEVGEVLAAGTTVVTVGDLAHPWLRGYISESNLGRVKLGAKVRCTTDSFPGKVYPGRVGFISPEAEFTPKQIQTTEERVKLVYRIKIDIENPDQELKLNMPVDAAIELR